MSDTKLKQLEDQLKRIGCNYRFWGRAEVRELANVLMPNETVHQCVNGSYEGGFALLAVTNLRVLLIDKKPFYLTLEDIRFDMISEVDYNHRLLNATIFICTPNKSMRFLGYNHDRLRSVFNFIQTKVMEIRQHYAHQLQGPAVMTDLSNQFSPYLASQQSNDQPALPATADPTATTTQGSQPHHPMAQMYRVAPIISAYTRLPMMSRQRRFLGSKAMNTPLPSMYQQH